MYGFSKTLSDSSTSLSLSGLGNEDEKDKSTSDQPETDGYLEQVKVKIQITLPVQESFEHNKGISEECPKVSVHTVRAMSQDTNSQSGVSVTEEFSPQRWLVYIKRLWNLLIEKTGVKFGVIPPHLLKERVFEHWLHLNIESLPVQYFYSDGTVIEDENGNHETPKDIGAISFSAALLFNEYVRRILKEFKKQESDACATFITLLEDLSELLQDGMFLFRNILSHWHRPKFNRLLLTKSKAFEVCIIKIEETLLSNSIDELGLVLETYTVKVTEIDLLLNILGLDPTIAEKMIDIDDDLVLHQSPLFFILNIMESYLANEENIAKFENELKTRISKSLFFNEQIDSTSIDFDYFGMQSPFYWAKAYLECDFSSHPLLTMLSDRDPQTEALNGWWSRTYKVYKKYSTYKKSIELEALTVASEDEPQVTTATIITKFQLDGHSLLYHGTIRTDDVLNGLTLLRLSPKQDFSHGDGFYLHESYGPAREWAEKRRQGSYLQQSSVIVYRVPNDLLTEGLDLSTGSTNDIRWLKVIKYYRTGCLQQEGVPENVIANRYTFIRGHICQNGYSYQHGSPDPIKYKYNGEIVCQWCIRGNDLLDKLSYLPVAVINITR